MGLNQFLQYHLGSGCGLSYFLIEHLFTKVKEKKPKMLVLI